MTSELLSSSSATQVDSVGFSQHMVGPTLCCNHTLNLVLTFGTEVMYFNVFPSNPTLSDHSLIPFQFTCNNDVVRNKRICYNRNLSDSVVIKFKEKIPPLLVTYQCCHGQP